jgi:hypothetical protein
MAPVVILVLACIAWGHAKKSPTLGGVWEYRQASLPGELDPEGEILEFTWEQGKWTGIYRGLQREGEHGLFYTWVEMDSVRVDSVVSFTVPARDFFTVRPRSKADLSKPGFASAGFTRGVLKFRGRQSKDRLSLQCTSDTGECPDRTMEFRKGPWPERKK